MMSAESTIDLPSPVGRVWRVLVDIEEYRQWHPFITISGPAEPNAEIKLELKPAIGFIPAFGSDARLVRLERLSCIAWRLGIKGLIQIEQGFELAKHEEGSKVTGRIYCTGALSVLRIPLLERRMARSLAVTNTALARFLARGTTIARYTPGMKPRPRAGR